MNLWSHRFSQNMDKKFVRISSLRTTEQKSWQFFVCFGRNDDFIYSFWNWLTFTTNTLKYLKTFSSDLLNWSKYLGCLKINLLGVRNPCMQRNGFVCLKFAALGDLSILTRFLLLTKAFKMATIWRFDFLKYLFN